MKIYSKLVSLSVCMWFGRWCFPSKSLPDVRGATKLMTANTPTNQQQQHSEALDSAVVYCGRRQNDRAKGKPTTYVNRRVEGDTRLSGCEE